MKHIAMLLVVLVTLSASTQMSTSLNNLTLKEALERVAQDNLELKVAHYTTKMQEEASFAAFANHFGSLELVQNILRSNDAGNVFGFKVSERVVKQADFMVDDLNNPGIRNYFQTKLHYELPIFVGGKILFGSAIAQAMKDLSTLDATALKHKKVYEITKSFYDVALLNAFIENLTTIQKNMMHIESMTQTMIKEGYAKQVDMLEVQSKMASVDRLLAQSKGNRQLALHFISFLVDQEVSSIDTTSLTRLEEHKNAIDVESLLMVKKAQKGVDISNEMFLMGVSEFLPTMGAFIEYSSADQALLSDFDLKRIQAHESYTAGIQLKMNLFNGFKDIAKLEEARLGALKAKTQLGLAKKGLALQINKLTTEIDSLNEELKSITAQLRLQEQIVENYQDRYAEKLVPISKVIMVESEHLEKVLELQKISNERNDKILQLSMLTQGE